MQHSDIQLLIQLLRQGPADAPTLCRQLGISQPTLSRRIALAGDAIIRTGKARAVRYFARRRVAGLAVLPLYRVTLEGKVEQWAELLPVHPGYVIHETSGLQEWHEGLPWWLQDMRPQGFLGRTWVRHRAPVLGLPDDLLNWADDDVITALAAGEYDVPGNLLLGEQSRAAWLAHAPVDIAQHERQTLFPKLAAQAMAGELAGSSAGGEQPKFTACVDGQPVIVKFSASQDNAISQRWRDLLLAEHMALALLAEHGLPAARSEWINGDNQRFLQIQRFDRSREGGRRGVVSLASLEAAFLGLGRGSWPQFTERLYQLGVITQQSHYDARRLYAFGRLIGNSDMHNGNIAFLHTGTMPLSLAPAYDMLPMALAPDHSGAMRDDLPEFTLPAQPEAEVWREMLPLALTYWQSIAHAAHFTRGFNELAHRQVENLEQARQQISRLT